MYTAKWNGAIIAQSDATVMVEGNVYFPKADVNSAYLVESNTTSVCPWKGEAHYYSLSVNGSLNEDAAWYYPAPKSAAQHISGYVAFWKGVQIEKA
ncbi:MAG: DUF427 domain-containing protein [Erysipelotrichaceae bacterium]